MKFEAITIKDIAKALGLSTSTVSRAIRDNYAISPVTKQLVVDYAKKINYYPNPIALSLKEKRSRSIGVIVSEIANNFFSQAINGIESIAYKAGYNVIVSQTTENFEREILNTQILSSRSVDGFLISISSETNEFSHIAGLFKRGLPIVCFDRMVEGIEMHKVFVDNFQGAYDGTIHLAENGYERIAFLGSSECVMMTKERLKGYRKALEDKKILFEEAYAKQCMPGRPIYEEVERSMGELMSMKHKPDAIFVASDKAFTDLLRYCKLKKIHVPQQIALAGFSNLEVSDLLCPSLTVVSQPAFEMGQIAAELLIKTIESKRPVTKFETRILATGLLVRESSAKRKK